MMIPAANKRAPNGRLTARSQGLGGKVLQTLLFLLTFSIASNVLAQITELCSGSSPCPRPPAVIAGENAQVQLSWRGIANAERPSTIVSDAGVFAAGRSTIGTHSVTARGRVSPTADGLPARFTIVESLPIPAAVSARAAAMGTTRLSFSRQFTFEGVTVQATQEIPLIRAAPTQERSIPSDSEPTSSSLSITRIALRFDDGKLVTLIPQDAILKVTATVNYQRSGVFNAVWEATSPLGNASSPSYRQLKFVRQTLGAGNQVVLESPRLPTQLTGVYRVRLRVLDPTFSGSVPELRYQVQQKTADETAPVNVDTLPEIQIQSPTMGGQLDDNTLFRWAAVPSSASYQLELYAKGGDDKKPLTGIMVGADTMATRLPPNVLDHLTVGREYLWRVIAIDQQGNALAASPFLEIKTNE